MTITCSTERMVFSSVSAKGSLIEQEINDYKDCESSAFAMVFYPDEFFCSINLIDKRK